MILMPTAGDFRYVWPAPLSPLLHCIADETFCVSIDCLPGCHGNCFIARVAVRVELVGT